MRRTHGAKLTKAQRQSLIVDALFKPLEYRGFHPSFRSIRRMLDVLGVPIGNDELLDVLAPWLAAGRNACHETRNGSRNGISAQTERFGPFRNAFEKSRNGISAQTERFAKTPEHAPDSPVRPGLYKRPPHANPSPKGAPLLLQDAIVNDELANAEAAARAERFRIARELLAETERRNREAANEAEKEPAPCNAGFGASDADRQAGAGSEP